MRFHDKTRWRYAVTPGIVRATAFVLCFMGGVARADQRHDFFLATADDNGYWLSKMVQNGADPNIHEEQRGDTGLILALREHAMRAFDVLLAAPNIDLNATTGNGDTALMIASYTGNEAAVTALLDKGAAVDKQGWTPLHYAAAAGNQRIVRLLLDKSARVDAAAPNGTTPLMMAAGGGNTGVVRMLLEAGADPALKNMLGMNALDFARKDDRRSVVAQLTARMEQVGQ